MLPPRHLPAMNELILGDNLEVLRQLPPDSVDLIYLDPPFFSNRTYEVIWGDAGERRSFEDRWSGGSGPCVGAGITARWRVSTERPHR